MGYLFQIVRCTSLALALAGTAVAQVSILQIHVIEGEGAVHRPGARTSHIGTVAVTDEAGKPVSGAAVSFHLPEDGPGGTFVNGLRTDVAVTDALGRAEVHAFQANWIPGRFQLRIVASKEQARAGTVSFQYVGEPGPGAAQAHPSRKWIALAVAAAGGVLAGTVAVRGSSKGAPTAPAVIPPPTPSITIGLPTITVGKP